MTEWQPIDTAPRDGTMVILYRPTHRGSFLGVCGGKYNDDSYSKRPKPYWSSDVGRLVGITGCREAPPTHWMPFPEPPKV